MANTIDALEARYRLFSTRETPWAFFMGLGDYLDYAVSVPSLKKAIDREFAKRNAFLAEIDKLEDQTLKEMRSAKDELIKIIEKHKADVKKFDVDSSSILTSGNESIIEQLELFEAGKISVSGFHSEYLENFLFDIAANLLRLGYMEDLKPFMVSDREYGRYHGKLNGHDSSIFFGGNTRGNFIFSETWPKRSEKVAEMKAARQMEPWGAFVEVMKFWKARTLAAKNYGPTQVFVECWDDREYRFRDSEAADVLHFVNDLRTVANNHSVTENALKYSHIEDLRTNISTVHFHLVQAASTETSLPKLDVAAMSKALRNKRDQAWRGSVDGFMDEMNAFMDEYREDKQKQESLQQKEMGGKWWKTGSQPIYDNVARKIMLENKECQIPAKAFNLLVICERLFPPHRFLGEPLMEYEVISLFYKRADKDVSPRAFYDAVEDLNDRIEKDLKVVKMLKYQDYPRQVCIRKELFK